VSGCVGQIDNKLIGSWKSNREKSVAECFKVVPSRHNLEPDKQQRFAEIFGNITQTYTENEVTIESKGEIFTVSYKVVERGKNYLVVEYLPEISPEEKIQYTLRFEDNFNSYWVNEGTDFPENYTKIQKRLTN